MDDILFSVQRTGIT